MIVDEETESINPCVCGYKPDHYSIAYGRAPYSIYCKGCKKQFMNGSNVSKVFIEQWNSVIRLLEVGKIYNLETNHLTRYWDEEWQRWEK